MNSNNTKVFEKEKHIQYFLKCLQMLPSPYASSETSRMTFIMFILSSLDLMNVLEEKISKIERQHIVDWIYAQQVLPVEDNEESFKYCGFRGSLYSGYPFDCSHKKFQKQLINYDRANIAMTYAALNNLIILKDDFSRLNREAILTSLKYLQTPQGSFSPTYESSENDLRFTYCAFVICYYLNGWDYIDLPKALNYIKESQTYEYAISQGPHQESHGGSTYCGIASLFLSQHISDILFDKEKTLKWCLKRQMNGFHGRINKTDDTCYSFWIGASIDMLGGINLIHKEINFDFLLFAQSKFGGFSKYPGGFPDLLHSYLSLTSISLMGLEELKPLNPALNITQIALEHWKLSIKPKYYSIQ